MPARQTRVFVRSTEPMEDWAETVMGHVFRPLAQEFENCLEWFWFSRYGSFGNGDDGDCEISQIPDNCKQPLQPGGAPFHRSMRFRFSIRDAQLCSALEKRGKEVIDQSGYHVSDFRDYDYVADTGRDRFLGVENRQVGRAHQRAWLTTNFYWATSKVVLDALVGPDANGRFRMESNDDLSNNPRGSTFQSLLHLFCNITNAPTDVHLYRKATMSLLGFGTFMYPPEATPTGGWDQGVTAYPIRY